MNITNPKNMKDIQSKIKVITIDEEFSLTSSHSIKKAWFLFRQNKASNKQTADLLTKKIILDLYIETIHNTVQNEFFHIFGSTNQRFC